MSDTYSYEVLEPGGHARLVGNVLDRISRASANPASAVGSSRALLGDTETASWTERTTAADGAALIEAVHGRTLVWNQLANPTTSSVSYGVTFTPDESAGTVTISGTADSSTQAWAVSIAHTQNHKYLLYLHASDYTGLKFGFSYGSTRDSGNGSIVQVSQASGRLYVAVEITSGTAYSNVVCHPQIFDLTQMFGAGNEPSTVEEFESLYPKPYYPYDAGSLLPVRMEGVETVAADESWSSQRTIPASTYFPDGLRSAGTVYDELRADEAITRVGERAYQSGDESDASVITDGTVTHYALATPTTTPIDPPLPMSYRTGAGGTERVMVASGTTSAPPVFATRYPLDPTDLAASIAPVDGPTAKTNHQVGDLLMLGFTLCKVTTSIARGEAITIGTNVTQTSVAAEIAALS